MTKSFNFKHIKLLERWYAPYSSAGVMKIEVSKLDIISLQYAILRQFTKRVDYEYFLEIYFLKSPLPKVDLDLLFKIGRKLCLEKWIRVGLLLRMHSDPFSVFRVTGAQLIIYIIVIRDKY